MGPKSKVRPAVLDQLATGSKSWGELFSACRGQVSAKSTFNYGLKRLVEDGVVRKIVLPDGSRKYELVEISLEDPDPWFVGHIVDQIRKPPSREALEAAVRDFRGLCLHKRIWNSEEAIHLLRDMVENRVPSMEPSDHFDLLRIIVSNAVKGDEKHVKTRIRRLFMEPAQSVVLTLTDKPLVRKHALSFLEELISEREYYDFVKNLYEKSVRGEDDSGYGGLSFLEEDFKKLYATHEKDLVKFLYMFMADPDQKVRERAASFYRSIKSKGT